jgi:branched-chain amino acid transport system ATP-binding protein
MTTVLLETRGVGKSFGVFRALNGINMTASAGEVLAIVGPNGAGKTTLVNVLTGLSAPTDGEVFFMNRNIAGVDPVRLAELGLARTFQLIEIFPKLTVAQTIAAAIISQQKKRWSLLSALGSDRAIADRAREVARIFGLEARLDAASNSLSQGEKKLLDVASAFALDPKMILLDEPTSGVSTAEKHGIMETLMKAAEATAVEGIILVEHDMDLVAAYSHRVIALFEGKVLADLPPAKFFADPMILEAIVGKRRHAHAVGA